MTARWSIIVVGLMCLLTLSGCAQSGSRAARFDPPRSVAPAPPTQPVEDVSTASHFEDEPNADAKAESDTKTEPLELTLADLESLAFEHNPTLDQASARIEAARGRWVQAGLPPNPVVGYHATQIGNRDTPGQQGGFVAQRFITGGKLGLNRIVVLQEIQQAESDLESQQQRVLNDVRIRFFDVLIAQQRVGIARELVRNGTEAEQASQKRLDARQVGRNDLLQAQIEADSADILLQQSQNEHSESWRRLSAVVSIPDLRQRKVVGDLEQAVPTYSWDERLARLLAESPELAAAKSQVGRARAALLRASREWIPNIDVFASMRQNYITEPMREVTNVQVGIPLPIFDRNQGNVRSAEAQLIAAQRQVQRLELQLQDRLAVAFRRYENASVQVAKYAKRILPNARESLELVTTGYRERQVDYLQVLTAQRTFFQVNLEYLAAMRNLRATAVAIDGQLLTGSLNQSGR